MAMAKGTGRVTLFHAYMDRKAYQALVAFDDDSDVPFVSGLFVPGGNGN